MINNLLLCSEVTISEVTISEATIGDKLAEAGIVVLIGVSMVFLVLFLLIGVVKLLQFLNKLLNNWDDIMAVYRSNKADRKAIKKSYVDVKDEQINQLYKQLENKEITKIEFKAAEKQIKLEYKSKKPEIKQAIAELKSSQKQARLPKPESTLKIVAPEVGEEVVDSKLIAIISAAISVMTEQEQAERKVAFKVRSIKQVK